MLTRMLPLLASLILAAWPAHLTVATAGMSAEGRAIAYGCWHDPKSGYFLYKSIECDGAHTHITLTKDRRMVEESGFEVARFRRKPQSFPGARIEKRPLVLATKHGIRIGMSRDEVLRKLGTPVRTAVRGRNKEYWCALYKKVDAKKQEVLRNTYIFRNGELIELSIHLDAFGGGCGDDNPTSDEGWPWSKF